MFALTINSVINISLSNSLILVPKIHLLQLPEISYSKGVTMQEQSAIPFGIYISIILLIIILSGILGGIVNFFISQSPDRKADKKSCWGYVALGIVAAFVVPLFLNMISSNLLELGQSKPLNLFILCGFCLIAAVFSRNFLESVYSKIIQQVKKAENDAREVKEAASEPDEAETNKSSIMQLEQQRVKLSESEIKVLSAFGTGKYNFRSFSGIKNETDLAKEIVQDSLISLVSKELAIQTYGKDNQRLWYLTTSGKRLVGLAKK